MTCEICWIVRSFRNGHRRRGGAGGRLGREHRQRRAGFYGDDVKVRACACAAAASDARTSGCELPVVS